MKARAARFGASLAQATASAEDETPKRSASAQDEAESAKKKQRLERFGLGVNGSDEDKRLAREKRFAAAKA